MSSTGLAGDLLDAIVAGNHTLVLSNELLAEVARVLRYTRLVRVHGENEETIYNFVGWLRSVAIIVPLDPIALAPIRDANDIFVLQTTLIGNADVLSTVDRDFFMPPASVFLADCGIAVLTDVQLIARLRA